MSTCGAWFVDTGRGIDRASTATEIRQDRCLERILHAPTRLSVSLSLSYCFLFFFSFSSVFLSPLFCIKKRNSGETINHCAIVIWKRQREREPTRKMKKKLCKYLYGKACQNFRFLPPCFLARGSSSWASCFLILVFGSKFSWLPCLMKEILALKVPFFIFHFDNISSKSCKDVRSWFNISSPPVKEGLLSLLRTLTC